MKLKHILLAAELTLAAKSLWERIPEKDREVYRKRFEKMVHEGVTTVAGVVGDFTNKTKTNVSEKAAQAKEFVTDKNLPKGEAKEKKEARAAAKAAKIADIAERMFNTPAVVPEKVDSEIVEDESPTFTFTAANSKGNLDPFKFVGDHDDTEVIDVVDESEV